MLRINGEESNAVGKTIREYLVEQEYDPARVAVERNGAIVPKADYDSVRFEEGDSVEVVSFVGGG